MYRHYRDKQRWRRFVLVHGVRRVSDLGYQDMLERVAEEDPAFIYVPTVTREPGTGWPGLT